MKKSLTVMSAGVVVAGLLLVAFHWGQLDRVRLVGGVLLSDLLVAEGDVVLVIDPAECSSCSAEVARWIDTHRLDPDRVRLVLSRQPAPREVLELKLLRIDYDGVLKRAFANRVVFPLRGSVIPPSAVIMTGEGLRITSVQDLPSVR